MQFPLSASVMKIQVCNVVENVGGTEGVASALNMKSVIFTLVCSLCW